MSTAIVLAALVAGCESQPAPRTAFFFMEDDIAREGVLTRCNADREATADDVECVNARRAAAWVAAAQERERATILARESERKLAALRARAAREALEEERAAAAARAAAEAAYEQQWSASDSAVAAAPSDSTTGAEVPAFGAPLGPVLPSIGEATFDFYASGALSTSPRVDVPVPVAPSNDVAITPPELVLEEVAIIPRPFYALDEDVAVPH